jgi:uncharacterized membrane protein YdjX (TVP38/TMEM64 family)
MNRRTALVAAAAAAALVALALVGHEAAAVIPRFAAWVEGLGAIGVVVFVLGYAAGAVLLVPGSLLTLAAGAVFGLARGVAIVFAGATLGACAAFLIARYAARGVIERRIAGAATPPVEGSSGTADAAMAATVGSSTPERAAIAAAEGSPADVSPAGPQAATTHAGGASADGISANGPSAGGATAGSTPTSGGFRGLLSAIDKAAAERGLVVVLLLRLSPIVPFSVLNYLLGLSRVRFSDFALGSIGMLPGTLLYVYYGRVAGDLAAVAAGVAPTRGPAAWALLGVGLIATLAVSVLLARLAREQLRTRITDGSPVAEVADVRGG